jgi:hypothetical protein
MISVVTNLYTRGNEFKTLDGLDYIGYYHINNSGSAMTQSDYVEGVSKTLMMYIAMPETPAGDVISEYDEENNEYIGIYNVIPVKNYKNDIDLPEEVILLEDPVPVSITDQPDIYFRKNTEDTDNPGLDIFIDESNVVRVTKGATITLQFGYRSSDSPNNIKFEWFDSFDRLVSNDPILYINTGDIDTEEERFYCTITDSYGSDTTNEITLNIVDPEDNPYIRTNILENANANEGTSNWDSVGKTPEDVGKFLPEHEPVEVPDFIFGLNAGTYFYHKFISGSDSKLNKNQWYPRPEEFDLVNGFKGTVVEEIKDSYFRAGTFDPVVRSEDNDHSGTIKDSTQVVDLTEFADAIDGKVFGLKGFHVSMFGWLGGRADQADRVSCEIEFLDANDEYLIPVGNTIIEDVDWYQRTVNEYKILTRPPKKSVIHAGLSRDSRTGNPILDYRYTGLYKDGNNGINFDRYQIESQLADGSIRIVTPVVKTLILGRTTDMVELPKGTRKIRVIKRYYHVPGVVDLIWEGKAWKDAGNEYISDAMVTGLNVRLYPILINTVTGTENSTGFDSEGKSVIKLMDFIDKEASTEDLAELGLVTDGSEFGTQYYDNQELQFDPVTPVRVLGQSNAEQIFSFFPDATNAYDKRNPVLNGLTGTTTGAGWGAYLNDSFVSFLDTHYGELPPNDRLDIRKKIGQRDPVGLGGLETSEFALLTGESEISDLTVAELLTYTGNTTGIGVAGIND